MTKNFFNFIIVFFISLQNIIASDKLFEGEYYVEQFDKHKVHLLILDPTKYDMQIVSSHNSVFGRSRLDEIVSSAGADIGVNAGFFEIGANKDGMPSGALVINGKFYGMQSRNLPCIIQRLDLQGQRKVNIENFQPQLSIDIAGRNIKIDQFNKFIVGNKIYIHNDAWGNSTLSNYDNRQEIIINSANKIIAFNNHGNNNIPKGGHVISFPSANNYKLDTKIIGSRAKFNWKPEFVDNKNTSIILGLPRLINNGKILGNLNKTTAHARTAFGITKKGEYVIVVAEHFSLQDIKNLTLQDIGEILNHKKNSKHNTKLDDLKNLIRHKVEENASVIGLTTHELAEYMYAKGCVEAINLDGGGSSSLYLKGQFVNTAFGDIDEGQGVQMHRAIANALVFKMKI